MRTAILIRTKTSDAGTFGRLVTDRGTFFSTGELPWRNNAKCRSSIPPGTYRCTWRVSTKYRTCYELENVPGRTAILIHVGNFCGDTTKGFESDVEGCILLGTEVGELARNDGKLQVGVKNSKVAIRDFVAEYKREPFELTIVDQAA